MRLVSILSGVCRRVGVGLRVSLRARVDKRCAIRLALEHELAAFANVNTTLRKARANLAVRTRRPLLEALLPLGGTAIAGGGKPAVAVVSGGARRTVAAGDHDKRKKRDENQEARHRFGRVQHANRRMRFESRDEIIFHADVTLTLMSWLVTKRAARRAMGSK
jgi:hypothetical protein